MRIGIIGPSPAEIMPFIEKMEQVTIQRKAALAIYSGVFHHHQIHALICGVGKVNAAIAATTLIDHYELDLLLVVGVAGAIGSMAIADTLVVTKVAHHDVDQSFLQNEHPFLSDPQGYISSDPSLIQAFREIFADESDVYFGALVTGEYFVDQHGRDEIIRKYDPMAVDMETVAIAQSAMVNDVPFIALRSITDTPDESGIENFRINLQRARDRSLNLLEKALLKLHA